MVRGRVIPRAELAGKQGRTVLAALVLSRPNGLRTGQLIELLWPAKEPADALSVLRSVLSRLRRVFGKDAIVGTDYVRVVLAPGAVVDVDIAPQRLREGELALAAKDFATAYAATRAGLDALAAPLLPEFDDVWVIPHRQALENLEVALRRMAVRAALGLGGQALEQAREDAKRLVADHPHSESDAGLLIDVHEARGDIAEALLAYEQVRRRLRDDVGKSPSTALTDRQARLLAAESVAPTPVVADAGTPFVGREPELARLRRQWKAERNGCWRLVVLEGEAGVGKTRLAEHFARELDPRHVLRGRCDEDPIVPFQPFVEAFGHLDALTATGDDEELHALAPLMPNRGFPSAQIPVAPEMQRYAMFEAVAKRLSRWTHVRPLLLLIDDLHWADQPTVKLLRHLARSQLRMNLMVLATCRSEETASSRPFVDVLEQMRQLRRLDRHRLAGLTRDETEALVRGRIELATADFSPELWAQTDGNPLFIEEVLRSLGDRESDEPPSARMLAEMGVPDGVKSMIVRRLRSMPDEAADALGTAAAIGEEFDLRLVAATRGRDVGEMLDSLDRAPTRGLIDERAPYRYRFSHAIVRRAIYRDLGPTRRAHLHARLATLIEAEPERSGHAAEVAHHLMRAGPDTDPSRILDYLLRAADDAAQAFAWEEAGTHYRHAAETLAALGPEHEAQRCRVILAWATNMARAGMSQTARQLFHEAAASARARGDVEQLVKTALGLGQRFWEANVDARHDRDYRLRLREALALLPGGDSEARVRLLSRLAEQLAFLQGDDDEDPIELSAEAVAMARRLGNPRRLRTALMARHSALLHVAHSAPRLEIIDDALELSGDDPSLRADAQLWRIYDLCELGRMKEARMEQQRLSALAQAIGLPLVRHVAIGWESLFTELAGEVELTEPLAAQFLTLGERAQMYDARSTYVAKLFALYRWTGRLDELREEIEKLAAGDIAKSAWRATLALYKALTGDVEGGRADARTLVGELSRIPRDFFWLSAVTVTAECVCFCEDAASVDPLYDALSGYADRHTTHSFGASWGSVERPLGNLAALAGREHAAEAHLRQALAANTAIDAPVLVAVTKCDYGDLLVRRGDGDRAQQLSLEAEQTANTLGLSVLADRAARLYAAAGNSTSAAPSSITAATTPKASFQASA